MARFHRLSRGIVFPLIVSIMASTVAATSANAKIVGTTTAIEKYNARQARDRLETLIQREDVQKEFKARGVSPAEAKARVDAMSDEQVAEIVNRIDKEPAGGSAVAAVVGAALIVFLVLLATDILCVTHVFKFTKCVTN
jgi:outer membrane murein-binding lipoprotein Lpp